MFTNDEINLMCIYNTGTREGLIAELTQMRDYLGADEAVLMKMTDSVLERLRKMDDASFAQLELVPEFDE